MKLHIPSSLRAALLACVSLVAPLAQTVSTGAFVGGVVTCALLAPQAQAADTTITETGTWGTDGTTVTTATDSLTFGNGTDTLDIVLTLVSDVEAASVKVTNGTTLTLAAGGEDADESTNYDLDTSITVESGANLRVASTSAIALDCFNAPSLTINVTDGATFTINPSGSHVSVDGGNGAEITIGKLNFSGTTTWVWGQYTDIYDTDINVTGDLSITFGDSCNLMSGTLTGDGDIVLTGSGWSCFYFDGIDASGFTGTLEFTAGSVISLGDLSKLGYSELILTGGAAPSWTIGTDDEGNSLTSDLGNVTLNGGTLEQKLDNDVLSIDTLKVTSSGGTLAVGDKAAVDITIDELTGEGNFSITVGTTIQTREIEITEIVDFNGTITNNMLSDTEGAGGGTVTISSISVGDGINTVLSGNFQSSNLSVSSTGSGSVTIASLTTVAAADGSNATLSMNQSALSVEGLIVNSALNLVYDGSSNFTSITKAIVTTSGSLVLNIENLTGLGTEGYYDLGISGDLLASTNFELIGLGDYSLDNTTYGTWVLVYGDGGVVTDPEPMVAVDTVTFTDESIEWGTFGDFISDEESVITFGDGTADTVITLIASEAVTAASVTVASGTSLTIQGSGALDTTLTVEAGGSLTMGGTQDSLDVILGASVDGVGASMYLSSATELSSLTMNDGAFLNVYNTNALVNTDIIASGTVTLQRDFLDAASDSALDSSLTISGTGTFQLVNGTGSWSYVSFAASVTHTGTLEIIDTNKAGAVYLANLGSFDFSEVIVSGGYLIFGTATDLDKSGTNFTMDGSIYTDNHSGLTGTVTGTTFGNLTVTTGTVNDFNVNQGSASFVFGTLSSTDLTSDTTDDVVNLNINMFNTTGSFSTDAIKDVHGTITISITVDESTGAFGTVSTGSLSAGEGINTVITGGALSYTGDTLSMYTAGSISIDTLNLTQGLTLTYEGLAAGCTNFVEITSITGDQTITIDISSLTDLEFGDIINLGLSTSAIDESLISYDTNQGSLSNEDGYWVLEITAGGSVLTWGNGLTDLASEDITEKSTIFFSGAGESTVGVTTEVTTHALVINAGSYTFSGTGSMTTGSLDISEDATLVLSANTTVTGETEVGASASLSVSEGFTLQTGSLTVEGSFTNAGTTTVTGAMTQGENATITNTGTLNVGDGTVLDKVSGGNFNVLDSASDSVTVTLGSITEGTSVSVGSGSTLKVNSNTTLNNYSSAGSIDVGSNSLTLTGTVTSGGNITAGSLVVQAEGATLGKVTADSITLNAIEKNGDGTSILTVESLNSEGNLTIDLSGIITSTDSLGEYDSEAGLDYTLITGSGDSLLASGFTSGSISIDSVTQSIINDYAMDKGLTTELVVDGNNLVLNFVALEEGELSLKDGYYSTKDEEGNTVIVDVFQEGSDSVLGSYDVLDKADEVTVDADKTLSLAGTGDGGNATINNLSGDFTLTLDGSSATTDSFTIVNGDTSTELNGLVVKNTSVVIDNASDSTISIDKLTVDGGLLQVKDGATLNAGDMTVSAGSMEAIQGSSLKADSLTITQEGKVTIGAAQEGVSYNDTTVAETTVTVEDSVEISDSGTLTIEEGATFTTGSLTTADSATIVGTVNLAAKGEATLAGNLEGMDLVATSGSTITVADTSNTSLGSLTVDNAEITLGAAGLVLTEASSITNSTVDVTISDSDITAAGSSLTLFVSENTLTLSDSSITLTYDGDSIDSLIGMEIVIADDLDSDDVEINIVGENVNGYLHLTENSDGSYSITFNDDVYGELGLTENGEAGLSLATNAVSTGVDESGDLGKVLKALNEYAADGNSHAGDTLGAALAGATTTSLGSAAMSDVSRQLGTIRNRTRAMGVNPTVVNENMPYVNAWISAEGGSSELDADGTAAGHTLDSTGGSVGVDIDVNDMLSIGFAYSYLLGDLSAEGADTAEGDLDSMYGSVYARINSKRWTHSVVATFGSIDASLDRTVSISETAGSYKTKGETDGSAFGLMYEVGYTYAMDQDATSCIQPVFNVSYVNSSISGYTESGSDAALTVGDQDNNYVTFGLGAVFETVVGENVYNRASVLSTRLMLKADAGDRQSEADVSLASNNGHSQTVKGAEIGAVGAEFGLGITIPVTEDVGALFADVSCELRSGMTELSGSVGYRFTF